MMLDEHGQPGRRINAMRRQDRTTQEVLGFLRGILADGRLTDEEIWSTYNLLCDRQGELPAWLVNALSVRLYRACQDGRIDESERQEITGAIMEILGSPDNVIERFSTNIPLTKPEPEVIFDQNEFVLTGRFVYGPRKHCENEILSRGGIIAQNVTLRTSYLVVGTLGSRDWVNTAFGRKIEKAVEYRERCGASISIISERRWLEFL
jgi:NAD-dependent DNA ligase